MIRTATAPVLVIKVTGLSHALPRARARGLKHHTRESTELGAVPLVTHRTRAAETLPLLEVCGR